MGQQSPEETGQLAVVVPRSLRTRVAELALQEGVSIDYLVGMALMLLTDQFPRGAATGKGEVRQPGSGATGRFRWFQRGRTPQPSPPATTDNVRHLTGSDADEDNDALDISETENLEPMRGHRYSGLQECLEKVPASQQNKSMRFSEIERCIGHPLPASAHKYRPWFGNNAGSHVQARAWLDAGWEVDSVDLRREIVWFRRKR
jgi:hypothetical protein